MEAEHRYVQAKIDQRNAGPGSAASYGAGGKNEILGRQLHPGQKPPPEEPAQATPGMGGLERRPGLSAHKEVSMSDFRVTDPAERERALHGKYRYDPDELF